MNIQDYFPPYLLEWFLVPLALFLLLFWWRDNLNILHMPLADLVAVLVTADVAMAIHYDELHIRIGDIVVQAPQSVSYFWLLAALGIATCALLVFKVEQRIRRVAIHHISVGFWHNPSKDYLEVRSALQSREFQFFAVRWAFGFAVTVAVVAIHAAVLRLNPLGFLGQAESIQGLSQGWQVVVATVGTFFLFLLIANLSARGPATTWGVANALSCLRPRLKRTARPPPPLCPTVLIHVPKLVRQQPRGQTISKGYSNTVASRLLNTHLPLVRHADLRNSLAGGYPPDGYVFFNRQPIIMEIGRPIMMI